MTGVLPLSPASLLARHRILSPTSGLRVSPLCLGAMNFGTAWTSMLGECSKETAFSILDTFYAQGGNFIDTAVNYQFGQSEQWLGEWMEKKGVRDEMVIATKFTGSQRAHESGLVQSNFAGNGRKNVHTSIERSLGQLKTSYVDIYYVHLWDATTSIPELMHTLHTLVLAQKVLYLGISDTPAWLVVKANAYAREHSLTPFVIYQGRWSAAQRDFEREIIPMCLSEGMALAPWGALGGGYFKPATVFAQEREDKEKSNGSDTREGRKFDVMTTGKEERVSAVLETIANRKNTPITSVALAYVMHKSPYVFPIIGGRKVSHLHSNIAVLGLKLSDEEMQEIDGAYGFEMGFPHSFLNPDNTMILGPEDITFNNRSGHFDYVVGAKPIPPHEGALDRPFKDIPKAVA